MSLAVWFFDKFTKKMDLKRLAGQKKPDGVSEINNIPYLGDGHNYHLLDIYKPEGATDKLPVIIDVHGGGWVYGDKELNKYYCLHLAKFGFAVVNISYRLSPEVNFSGTLKDVFAAMNFVLEHGEEYGLDTNNVFLTGDSAGGHAIALALATQKSEKLQKFYGCNSELKIKAAGFTCAAFNPTQMAKIKGAGAVMFNDVFGKGYLKNQELLDASDFINNVPDDMCPSYIISAYADFLKGQCEATYKWLKDKGVECEFMYFDGPLADGHKLIHVYNVIQPWWEASVMANKGMVDFFRKHIV